MALNGTLADWGKQVLIRDKFVCRYCGLDGKKDPLVWMQFSIDHVIPTRGVKDYKNHSNMVACCRSCNSITSQMTIAPGTAVDVAIEEKREKVRVRLAEYKKEWDTQMQQIRANNP